MTAFTTAVHQNEILAAGRTEVAAVVAVAASGYGGPDVRLRLWTPRGATVAFLRQVAPRIEELTGRGRPVDELTDDYPTGAWGEEARDYHLGIRVTARDPGEEMLAGRISVIQAGEVRARALIRVTWAAGDREGAQAELAAAIQAGLEARRSGDAATATARLGRAVALAAAGGEDATLRLLAAVVEIDDPATGTVRLRADAGAAAETALSTRTVRLRAG